MTAVYQKKLEMVTDWQDRLRDPDLVERLVEKLDEMLDKLELHIGDCQFIAGSDYSLADAAWTALLGRLEKFSVLVCPLFLGANLSLPTICSVPTPVNRKFLLFTSFLTISYSCISSL